MNSTDARTMILAGSAPDGLTVDGSLDLRAPSGVEDLPEGLTVGRNLILRGCTGLTELPEGLTVGRNLDLGDCTGMTALPDGLTVGGAIYLGGCTGLTARGTINGVPPLSPREEVENLRAVAAAALAAPDALNMNVWHTCDTTHCIAGWAQHLSRDPAIKTLHPSVAGTILLGARMATHFFDSEDDVRNLLASVIAARDAEASQ